MPAPEAAATAADRPRGTDVQAAMNEPLVRKALDVFQGTLMRVDRESGDPIESPRKMTKSKSPA